MRLKEESNVFGEENYVVEHVAPEKVEYIPFRFHYEVVGQEEVLKRALDFIEETSVVGIWGMGGVGKTTLLKCIYNNFCTERHPFAVVVFFTVGRDNENITGKMQAEIGETLGLDGFSINGDERKQKSRIFNSLKSMNFLLLVDDLWKHIDHEDLEKIGIPPLYNTSEKKQKMIIATRERRVCCQMNIKKNFTIDMGLLNEEESRELFRIKVHDEELLERREIHTVANDIIKECGQLPLALHHVGESMTQRENGYEWKKAKEELECFQGGMKMQSEGNVQSIVFNRMVENVLSILKFSYEELNCKCTRAILLNLFHSHGKHLVEEAISQRKIVEKIIPETIYDTAAHSNTHQYEVNYSPDTVNTSIRALVNSSLLMENGKDLKLHVCVYDMLVWLSCTGEYQTTPASILIESPRRLT